MHKNILVSLKTIVELKFHVFQLALIEKIQFFWKILLKNKLISWK